MYDKPREKHTHIVSIDGEGSDSKAIKFRAKLRRKGLHVKAVHFVRKDETNALIRLADALAGMTIDILSGNQSLKALLDLGVRRGVVVLLGE